jgi:hypothetical protein
VAAAALRQAPVRGTDASRAPDPQARLDAGGLRGLALSALRVRTVNVTLKVTTALAWGDLILCDGWAPGAPIVARRIEHYEWSPDYLKLRVAFVDGGFAEFEPDQTVCVLS